MNNQEKQVKRLIHAGNMRDRRAWKNLMGGDFNFYTPIALLILAGIWFIAARTVNKPFIFPTFESVVSAFFKSITDLYVLRNIGITMKRVMTGVLYAFIFGLPIGMFMGYSSIFLRTFAPFINSLRQVPIMAWVPLSIIWFGLGDGPTVFMIAFTGVFTIILNTIAGVQDIDRDYYNAARSMGAGTAEIIRDVVLPGSLPGVITGIRLAIGMGWMSVIWAEFIATSAGFGYCMVEAQSRMQTDVIIAYMFIAGLIGFSIDKIMLLIESILLRWKAS